MPDLDPPFIIMLSLADISVCACVYACVSALTSFTYMRRSLWRTLK